ncbi:MAG: FtsX-like permease family protein, partial [Gemmatimonadaceae bacterium]
VVGKELRIDGAPHTIIGVFPPQANFPSDVAMWLPLRGNPQQQGESYSSDGIGRLKAGVTLTQAEQSLLDAHASIWATKDTSHTVSPRVDDLRERFVGDFAIAGKALAISAAFVLLIACANVCGTMLARSIARRREITVRVALGASASRVVRQLLTESLTLSIVAGVFGTALAQFALFSLLRTNSDLLPVWARPSVDVSSVLFAVSIVATTTLLFGLAPALQLRRHVRNDAASSASRVAGSVPERRVLNILVCTEVALAAVLLVSGGLLFRTYQSMREVKPGFRTEGVATFRVSLPQFTYPNGSAQLQLYNRLLTRLVAIPGVDHVGGVSCLPFSCHLGNFFRAENAPPPKQDASNPVMLLRVASPDYFVTMGITLRSGRFFRDGEGGAAGATRVAVVNQQFADRLWPDANPIGRRFEFSGDTPNQWVTVVGVVNDVRHYGLAKPMTEGLYLSTTSIDSTSGWRSLGFAVHTKNSADDILPALRAAVHDVDSELPVFELQTMSASLERSMSKQRLMAFALMVFATVAVALAVGGIYAVLSYVVGQRRREIAIRMALGARSEQVLLLVMKQGMRLVVIGLIIGVPIAMGVSRAMSSLLIGISARDPMIFFLATLLLTGVGALAAMIPALRASHLEPKSVLAENA